MRKVNLLLLSLVGVGSLLFASDVYLSKKAEVPDISMKNTKLNFKDIEGYQNYKIVASHFRKDKNEIRYILANPVAYNAMMANIKPLPNGSKVVKIGWSVKKMSAWQEALEADKIQRVEYMIKDSTKHKESDGWGYARFVKKDGKYKAWDGDPKSCVACHASVKSNDFLFTKPQKLF